MNLPTTLQLEVAIGFLQTLSLSVIGAVVA
jgi:hypothetical protein